MDTYIEKRYTGLVMPYTGVDAQSAFFALSFPAYAQIERIVVIETSTTPPEGLLGITGGDGAQGVFTVDVFNSATAEGKTARFQSLYRVVPSQTAINSVMELFIRNGGMFRNTSGTNAAPISKIYVEVSVTGNAGVALSFDVTIGAIRSS